MNLVRPLPGWRHQRPTRVLSLALIVAAFAVLCGWNLARGGDFDFYAASARSMSESWRALAFGAFDPAATVTLDKLSGFAVPQAASIALFGMSTSSLALPQLIEGIVTVWSVSLVGLRWAGPRVGLLAAALAASTPIFVSMFGHPMEDGLLTMALAVALMWWQRAVLTGRTWPMLLAGLFVGVGFQAKMMQAWFILPGLLAGTVAAFALGPGRGRRALSACVALVVSSAAASLAWVTAIALTPVTGRPYVDGSLDDNVFAMVFGYNGIDRILPGAVPGAVGSLHGFPTGHLHTVSGTAHALVAAAAHTSAAGYGKLLTPEYATQVGWLYPAAIAGAILILVRWAPRHRRSGLRGRASFALGVALVAWLATATVVLSAIRLPHTAYVAAIGVQLALLAAVGWYELVRLARSSSGAARFALPMVVLVQSVWTVLLAVGGAEPGVLFAVSGAMLAMGLLASIALSVRRTLLRRPSPHAGRGPVLPALVALTLLAGPVCFSLQALDAARDGSGGDASVGVRLPLSASGDRGFRISAPAVVGGHPTLTREQEDLVGVARAEGGGVSGRPLMLTDSWSLSAAVISRTGASVLTDGGYSGSVPVFTAQAIRRMIASGDLRVLVVTRDTHQADPVRSVADSGSCRLAGSFDGFVAGSMHRHPSPARLYRCSA